MFSSVLSPCDETTEIVIKIQHNPSMVDFENHLQDALNEAGQPENKLPIGSGVTEAACKVLVKQRMCRSGVRWKEQGGQWCQHGK